jgi:hypothetical protein
MGKKTIEIDLEFFGDGSIQNKGDGAYFGGIVPPEIEDKINFSVYRQIEDELGILNPVDGEDTVESSFQINISGTSEGYRELGRYFLALAELDITEDPDFHEHLDDLLSSDDRTHLHLIMKKEA